MTPGLQSAGKAYVHIGDLVNGRAYAVAVRAMYTQGLGIRAISAPGLRSAIMTGTPRTVATAPRITTITTSGGSITIIFEAPKDNGGAAITNYAYSFGGSTWKAANPKTALGPIIISQLKPGMTYTVRLRAINAAGAGLASGIAAIVVKR